MKMKWVMPVLLLGAAALGQTMPATRPATRPAFTIGKDTTLVDGPLKADGTIDYIPAINALLGGNVKPDENAAIPLLLIDAGMTKEGKIEPRIRQQLEAMGAPVPEKAEQMEFLDQFAARKKGLDRNADQAEFTRLLNLEDRLILGPWKSQDQPLVAEWIDASAGVLKELEDASRRKQFYLPFCVPAEKSVTGLDGSAVDAEPFLSTGVAIQVLLSRGLMRAGAGDLTGALADIRVARKISRLSDQAHLALLHLQSLMVEFRSLRACAGIAVSGTLTREQLNTVRQEIGAFPPIAGDDPIRSEVEEMVALDLLMQCIGGKSRGVMGLMALDFSGTAELDLNDWKNADWNVALREIVKLYSEDVPGKTYLELSQNLEKKLANDLQGPALLDNLMSFTEGGNFTTIAQRVNAFLKRLPKESREDYTRRITRWLLGANLSDVKRNLGLEERVRMERVLALTGVALAEYRLAHGSYPETLDALQPAPGKDGFTGEPLHYRRDGEGFKLWSAGLNQKDDGGTKDDLVVGTP